MSAETLWGHFFKPEVKKRGEEDFAKGAVNITRASDTHILAYARGSSAYKVTFSCSSIASEVFATSCTCSAAAKGTFCKHIWATILAAQAESRDFLDAKTVIEMGKIETDQTVKIEPKLESPFKIEQAQKYAQKQADYKKAQNEKQKARAKEFRQNQKLNQKGRKTEPAQPSYPEAVGRAVQFFNENGFPLESPLDETVLKNAMKKLARIFHPDVGGSHEETVELNANYEIILRFIHS